MGGCGSIWDQGCVPGLEGCLHSHLYNIVHIDLSTRWIYHIALIFLYVELNNNISLSLCMQDTYTHARCMVYTEEK